MTACDKCYCQIEGEGQKLYKHDSVPQTLCDKCWEELQK